MTAIILALIIVAGLLAVVELAQTRGRSLLAWAILALALAGALPTLAAL